MPSINNKKVVVVTDAYSGGKYLIPSFQALGYPCIHVQSEFLPKVFNNENKLAVARCEKNIVYHGDIDALLLELATYQIKCVVPGSEGGVSLADLLNEKLELAFSNLWDLSKARRNKYDMQAQLSQLNIASIKQRLVKNNDDLQVWFQEHHIFPMVIKPVKSGGTDSVYICHTEHQVELALEAILSKKDVFNHCNQEALCQEYLDGIEFVINGIVASDNYFFTEIWRSQKKQYHGYPVYDTQYLQYKDSSEYQQLTEYTKKVCQALGIKNGAFHAEVMMTARGPVLIEIGSRIAGGADPYIIEECLGHSQISKLTQAVLYPQCFIEDMQRDIPLLNYQRAAYVFMIATKQGKVLALPFAQFSMVKGVVSFTYHYSVGETQQETRDLLSSPGVIILIHKNQTELDDAIAEIRRLEAQFYAHSIA